MQSGIIYGESDYTGRLIAIEAARRGMKPVLAGRGEAVLELAGSLGLERRRVDLSSRDAASRGIEGAAFVLHCAGPFSATSQPMLDACLKARAHYLDITGEVAV